MGKDTMTELTPFLEPIPENEVKKRLKRVKDRVDILLDVDERCRNDDKWLLHQYLVSQTGADIDFELFKQMPSFESITRCRRKLQEEGKYLSDNQIAEQREKESDGYREFSRE